MVFFKNYFHPKRQMPTTSEFRGVFFVRQLSLVDSDQLHLSSQLSVFFKPESLN